MAHLTKRKPENTAGQFFVDDTCIDCGLCRDLAPDFFRLHEESGQSVVYRQPVDDAARALAREALETCPTESIGEDDAA